MRKKEATIEYDVCIVGSGPAGLAVLSAIREPYSIDVLSDNQINRAISSMNNNKKNKKAGRHELKVCVIDVHNTWLHQWKRNFHTLDIQHLRSPTLAHPNMFDKHALLAYAVSNGREDELLESGCFDCTQLLALGQTQNGLWKLPSTSLFVDFCNDLAVSLKHDFVQGKITNIGRDEQQDPNVPFKLEIDNGQKPSISSKSVVLATGTIGRPIIPKCLQSFVTPESAKVNQKHCSVLLWPQLDNVLATDDSNSAITYQKNRKVFVVVGGGLTAVQVALKLYNASESHVVYLCSRRPLIEKHFDIGIEWFDQRTTNKCMSDFYHQSIDDRLKLLKQARDGGSVPPIYMKQIKAAEVSGVGTTTTATANAEHATSPSSGSRLVRVVGNIESVEDVPNKQLHVRISNADDCNNAVTTIENVDHIVLACGIQPDCNSNPLIQNILEKWPVETHGGLPCITEDCKWRRHDEESEEEDDGYSDDLPLYVVGHLGALNIGPDAGNIMGSRRAAQLVANDLGCRNWLRDESNNVMTNPYEAFSALLWSDSESDSDSDSDSESGCDSEIKEGSGGSIEIDSSVFVNDVFSKATNKSKNVTSDDDDDTSTVSYCSCCASDNEYDV